MSPRFLRQPLAMTTLTVTARFVALATLTLTAGACKREPAVENSRPGNVGAVRSAITHPVEVIGALFEVDSHPATTEHAEFFSPNGMVLVLSRFTVTTASAQPILFVSDAASGTIRRVNAKNGVTTTFAGVSGLTGSQDGPANLATFRRPTALAASTSALFVADSDNHVIRRINFAGTRSVTTVAGVARKHGSVDGSATAARFWLPSGLAYAPDSNSLFVADAGSSQLRRITFDASGAATVSTLTGLVDADVGGATPAVFNRPTALAWDESNDRLYVADTGNHGVRVVEGNDVRTLAGSPESYGADNATGSFAQPTGLELTGDALFVSDAASHTIRSVALQDGAVTTIAGSPGRTGALDGSGPEARLHSPRNMALVGSELFFTDQGNHQIRAVSPANGKVRTLVGVRGRPGSDDGWPGVLNLGTPNFIECEDEHIYVNGIGAHAIHRVDGTIRTLSPLDVVRGGFALTADSLYHSTTYGFVRIDRSTLDREVVHQGGGDSPSAGSKVGTAQGAYVFLDSQPTEVLSFHTGLAAPAFPSLAAAGVRHDAPLTASDTHVYFTSSVALFRFMINSTNPFETLTGYHPPEYKQFAVDDEHLYLTESTSVRVSEIASSGEVGTPALLAGAASASGATDGTLFEARFDGLADPICYTEDSLYVLEFPAGGGHRFRWLNLETGTVATIVPQHCTRILLEDFAGGLAGWTYQNNAPGSSIDSLDGRASYRFFFESGEGNLASSQSLARSFSVRPIAEGGTRLVLDYEYTFEAPGGLEQGSLQTTVTGLEACSGQSPVQSEAVSWGPAAQGSSAGSLSVDISAFEGCEVEVSLSFANQPGGVTPEELEGSMRIDDVRLEPAACGTQ